MDCRGFLKSYGQGPLKSWVLPSCWCYRGLWEFDKGVHGGILCFWCCKKDKIICFLKETVFLLCPSHCQWKPLIYMCCAGPQAAPRGQNQSRLKRNSIYKSSLLSLPSNIHGNRATSWATELFFVLPDTARPWRGPATALVPQLNMDWVFRDTQCLLWRY